ncbi:MAG: polysaccharide pyruvyl transferase family protein [Bacilli bacterium]|nr:polysaccharide pyruvyl transferase family protein [Bacilli bacterium]
MGNKTKITITNAYTWYNKGDAGILLATIDILKKIYKNVEFNILSFTPKIDEKKYCKDPCINKVYSNILNPYPYKKGKIGRMFAIIKLFIRLIILHIRLKVCKSKTIDKIDSLRVLRDSDIIIVCGGGFLGGKKYESIMHLYQIYIDTLFAKPVYIMGTSIEPIKKKTIKFLTERILKKVDFVFARERITYNYLSSFLQKNKYELIPDMAFALKPQDIKIDFIDNLTKDNNILFGITVRNWNFPYSKNKKEAMNNYIKSIVDLMIKEFKIRKCKFIFIPQVTVYTGDDTIIAKKIKNLLPKKNRNNFIIRSDDWSPNEIKSVIGKMNFFIGTRMHSNIFATSMCIPTTAIAYEKKTNGIMETVGLEDYIVEIDQINSNILLEKIENMIKNEKQIRLKLNNRIIEINKEIQSKIEKVVK